jgi:hypothetical protein
VRIDRYQTTPHSPHFAASPSITIWPHIQKMRAPGTLPLSPGAQYQRSQPILQRPQRFPRSAIHLDPALTILRNIRERVLPTGCWPATTAKPATILSITFSLPSKRHPAATDSHGQTDASTRPKPPCGLAAAQAVTTVVAEVTVPIANGDRTTVIATRGIRLELGKLQTSAVSVKLCCCPLITHRLNTRCNQT